ncbi:glycosyltransferase [Acidithiobacillus ferrooxidans]|uniref:Glycosyl transferase, group 1 (Modular protein) n=1 Tax=mine drainage metagenome TaxID=410659 RepID=E6QEN3_9ZZZZ|nr:rhamnan synthesis F family protein [Acidithiobacillus ferrooxidans]MBU2861282.1 glycosyltransferase [Acidithiobacillus ferrooxidans]
MQKQLLVVLGMHRSGTSAIARGLQALGASLGDALLPAGFDNPKGFWEDRDMLRINEALLAELQSAYDRVGLLTPDDRPPVVAALENDARTALAQKFAQVDFFALKDPRMARLLPFWQRVFAAADLSVAYVIALRNPLSVADSLARRNGFDRVKSALLWQEHLLAAVHHTQGQRRVVVDYDRLLDDPEAAFRRIAEQLGIAPVHPEALREYQANFLDASLRHTRYTREDVRNAPDLPQGVRDLYPLLADCAEDGRSLDDPALVRLVAEQREALCSSGPVLDLLGRLDARVQYQGQRLGEQDRVRTELEQTLTRLGEAHAEIHGEAQRLREERVEQEEKIVELQSQAAELLALRATRLWRLRDTLRLEPWSLGKAARIAHLSLSLATPAPLRRRIPAVLRRNLSARILPPAAAAGDFDADLYVHLYPDVAAAGVDPHTHYQRYGRPEGRLGQLPSIPGLDTLHDLDPDRETVLVVCHEGSRTGAPILGYNLVRELLPQYNVVTLFLGPGPMLEACRALGAAVLGPTTHHRHPLIADRTIAAILERVPLRFALINSVEARFPLAPLAHRHIPTISLLHEFAANTRPHGAFLETARWSGATVFSSRLTRDDAWASHGELREIAFPIIPQGRCVLPGGGAKGASAPGPSSAVRPADFPADGLVVLGLGGVHIRKGVDLFLDCAARVCRSAPDLPIRFVWVGKGYDPENDAHYSVYLADQIQRAGLAQRVQFLDELPDLQGVYAAADILLLSSRLDPLPNVAIDALSEGLPVLCFDAATGIADILREHGLTDACVAPYLDTARMAEQLLAIARSPALRRDLAERASRLAVETFRMPHYVARIVALAEAQHRRSQQEVTDIATIVDAGVLQPACALQPGTNATDTEEAAWLYVRSWASGVSPRKPFPGFHPGMYRERHGQAQPDADPLADYLRQGRPEGPWLLPLITPATPVRPVHGQRIALHIHAFYPDLVAPILDALGQNQTPMDLLVSVVDEGDRQRLTPLFQGYWAGRVEVRAVPNRGRDLGPFCTAFADTIRRNYDLVGHVHTKRSPEIGAEAGRQWVHFLLTNLLGGATPMADRILGAMAADPRLGMVFPDDPNIVSWGENRPHAEAMAQRLEIDPLPEAIVFPVGSMFWARVVALEPLLTLGLSWPDYPAEPLPYDGSLLHALERLLPLVVTKTGHTLALSHVPGVTR